MVEETVATVVGPQNMALQGMCYISQGTAFFFFSVRAAKVSTGDSIIKAYVEVCNWQPWLYPFNDG